MVNLNCHCAHSIYVSHSCGGEVKLLPLSPGESELPICSNCYTHVQEHDRMLALRYDLTKTI